MVMNAINYIPVQMTWVDILFVVWYILNFRGRPKEAKKVL